MTFFHVDGFLFFLLIGEFFALLMKSFFHRAKRWAEHVRYMTKLAGGSLLVDVEADYWLRKIMDPMYRPIWRWYFGKLWAKKYPTGVAVEKRKNHTLLKVVAAIWAILLLLIAVFAAFGVPTIVPGPVPVTVGLVVGGHWNLTQTSIATSTLGPTFDVTSAYNSTGNYSGGWVGLSATLVRTDASNADAMVFLNVTSRKFIANGEPPKSYVDWVTYLVAEGPVYKQYDVPDSDGQFGMLLPAPNHGQTDFFVYLHFRAFNSFYYHKYVTIQPTNSGYDSLVGISGGYYSYNTR